MNLLKRLVVILSTPFFLVGVVCALILTPPVWVLTGKNGLVWWVEHCDPFLLGERWGVIK